MFQNSTKPIKKDACHKLLLVDDEPNTILGLQRALHKEAYKVFTAISGYEANVTGLAKGAHVKALVADDNSTNRKLLSSILSNIGVEVINAENGREALENVFKYSPDIVFMDIHMPVMNGIEASVNIRKKLDTNAVKIVILTASIFNRENEENLGGNWDGFILKPFRIESILDNVSELLKIEYVYD